jgi:hypothetical protein
MIVNTFYRKASNKRVGIDKYDAIVSPVAEIMVDELLRVDTAFFKEFRYADSTQSGPSAREKTNIDNLI